MRLYMLLITNAELLGFLIEYMSEFVRRGQLLGDAKEMEALYLKGNRIHPTFSQYLE